MKDASSRRSLLLAEMDRLNTLGINCQGCSGKCCTSLHNSMQITESEAQDILHFLIPSGQTLEAIRTLCQENITNYRLNAPLPGNGKKNFLRRTYTCPFFKHQELGCALAKEVRPYGCLGFNRQSMHQGEGMDCHSDQMLLSKQQEGHNSEKMEAKSPIPVALLELMDKASPEVFNATGHMSFGESVSCSS